MIYLFYALLIGVSLGILSTYQTKLFLSGLFTTLVLGGLFLRPIILVGASASATTGRTNPFAVYIDGFLMLPPLLQIAIYSVPAFFFLGRFGAWFYLEFIKQEEVITEEERRKRIKAAHGWNAEKDREFSSKIRIRR
jgi:hypothetical protein